MVATKTKHAEPALRCHLQPSGRDGGLHRLTTIIIASKTKNKKNRPQAGPQLATSPGSSPPHLVTTARQLHCTTGRCFCATIVRHQHPHTPAHKQQVSRTSTVLSVFWSATFERSAESLTIITKRAECNDTRRRASGSVDTPVAKIISTPCHACMQARILCQYLAVFRKIFLDGVLTVLFLNTLHFVTITRTHPPKKF